MQILVRFRLIWTEPGLQEALPVSTRGGVQASRAALERCACVWARSRVSRTLDRNAAPNRLPLGRRAALFNRRVALRKCAASACRCKWLKRFARKVARGCDRPLFL